MGTPADMASPASAPYIPHNQSLSRLLPSARPPRGHPGASAAAGIHCPDRVGPGRRAGSPACLHDRIRSPFTCRMWRGASDPTHNHDNTGMRASVSRTKGPGRSGGGPEARPRVLGIFRTGLPTPGFQPPTGGFQRFPLIIGPQHLSGPKVLEIRPHATLSAWCETRPGPDGSTFSAFSTARTVQRATCARSICTLRRPQAERSTPALPIHRAIARHDRATCTPREKTARKQVSSTKFLDTGRACGILPLTS